MNDLIKNLADQAKFSIGEIQAEVLCPDCDAHNKNPELYKIIDEFMKFPTEVQWHIQDTLESKRKMFAELIVKECIEKIETHRIPVGNSPAGELACEWTYDHLKCVRDEIKEHFEIE